MRTEAGLGMATFRQSLRHIPKGPQLAEFDTRGQHNPCSNPGQCVGNDEYDKPRDSEEV